MNPNLIPIVNLGSIYKNGCQGAWASTTTRTISAGQLRDSTNVFDIVVPSTLTASTAFNGANGLDTGTIAASTMYAVYVIYDPTNSLPPAALISTSFTNPVMPSVNGVTYGAFRLVDFTKTDGSSLLLKDYNTGGNANVIYKQYDAPISVLSSGAATTYTAINLSSAVPNVGFGRVKISAAYTPNVAADAATFQPTGATADTYAIKGIVATVQQTDLFDLLPLLSSSQARISYKVTSASDSLNLSVVGYEFYV